MNRGNSVSEIALFMVLTSVGAGSMQVVVQLVSMEQKRYAFYHNCFLKLGNFLCMLNCLEWKRD